MTTLGKQLNVTIAPRYVLKGTVFDVRQLDSIAILLVDASTLRGLYRLSFSNGESYVGQAVNVINRFSSHRRRWEDIVQFEFFPIPEGDLNQPERDLINATEVNGPVRNKQFANRPLGEIAIEVETEQGQTVLLPWERGQRIRPGQNVVSPDREKFVDLASDADYDMIRFIAGWYIYNTIPDPFNTQRHLWTSTCLPSTNKTKDHQRLAAINCGALETLVMMESAIDDSQNEFMTHLFINTEVPDADLQSLSDPNGFWQVHRGRYKIGKTAAWEFTIPGLVSVLVGETEFPHMDFLLDSAYKLNVRLMRQNAGGMFRRFHNEYLCNDFLAASLRWAEE